MAFHFRILDQTGTERCSVFVSADDIADARQGDWLLERCTDRDVAVDVYEQRFESALTAAGLSYEQAAGFTCDIREEAAR